MKTTGCSIRGWDEVVCEVVRCLSMPVYIISSVSFYITESDEKASFL